MQNLIRTIQLVLHHTTFDAGRSRTYSLASLRELHRYDKAHGGSSADLAKAVVAERLLEMLAENLRPLLQDYIQPDSDRLGTGLVRLMGGRPQPTVPEFAQIVVRAAATLGSERATQLLLSWIEGKPLRYQSKALLSGATVDQPLSLKEGIQVTKLPLSTNELAIHLPRHSIHVHGYQSFLGRALLSINCQSEPALYLPSENDVTTKDPTHTWAQGSIPAFSLDTFCEALSLACNNCVRWKFSWRDVGDLQEFNTGFFSGPAFTDVPDLLPGVCLSQQHLEHAHHIHLTRHTNRKTRRDLDTAVSRWVRSKRANTSLPDRFIELRMALEALYLKDYSGELRFRLATHAAWHLANDFSERRDYYDIFRRVYQLASKAVHAGDIGIAPETRNLLETAQDLCRLGILKRLDEANPPNWTEMILGNRGTP